MSRRLVYSSKPCKVYDQKGMAQVNIIMDEYSVYGTGIVYGRRKEGTKAWRERGTKCKNKEG